MGDLYGTHICTWTSNASLLFEKLHIDIRINFFLDQIFVYIIRINQYHFNATI